MAYYQPNYNGNFYQNYPQVPAWNSTGLYSNQQNDQFLAIPINNSQQVDIYPVAAGTTVMLIDWEHGKMYSKTNPGNGSSAVIKTYTISEDKKEEIQHSSEPIKEYATKEDLNALTKQLNDIKVMLDDLTK